MVNLRRFLCVLGLMLLSLTSAVPAAQRELHWDALDVEARLDADGVLQVAERHTMVFTGDWNGGERVFNLRPRQKLEFLGMERVDAATGARSALRQAPVPDRVDEFSKTDARTVRWRSRLPGEPPFASSTLTYVLHYKLSGILLKDEERYRLDHDFAFPDRTGPIERFSLTLTLDPVWQPQGEVRDRYTAGPLAPGRSFVLTIPLRYSGTGSPGAIDSGRPAEVVWAVVAILGMLALGIAGFYLRERSLGRFTPVSATIDRNWIEENVLVHEPAVVGAAWDGRIGTPEVVALIAGMTAKGKLDSEVTGPGSMTLRLKVDRSTLDDHELALVEGLFFDDRTETSTRAVKSHYRNRGFDPVQFIKPSLERRVKTVLPPGKARVWWLPGVLLIPAGAALLAWTVKSNPNMLGGAIEVAIAFVVLAALVPLPGMLFRARVDWGVRAAGWFMSPALLVSLGTAGFLWLVVGSGRLELPGAMVGAIAVWAIYISHACINGMKSRQGHDAIAFRKRLAAGREYFQTQLQTAEPALRDNWYPWLLAFGLGWRMDVWSTRHTRPSARSSARDRSWGSSSSSSPSASSGDTAWTGGGGGRSGGAGASGTWAAAATGMAAGVAAPSSSSSGGGGSGGGGSSGGGSSGGGGGGGW